MHCDDISLLRLQAMRFGDLPGWVDELSHSIREAVFSGDNLSEHSLISPDRHEEECLFPILLPELLGREPLFDQLIVNLYHPGQVRYASLSPMLLNERKSGCGTLAHCRASVLMLI